MKIVCLQCRKLLSESYRYRQALEASNAVSEHYELCLICQSGRVCTECFEMVELADEMRVGALKDDFLRASFARLEALEAEAVIGVKLAQMILSEHFDMDAAKSLAAQLNTD